MKKRTLNLVLCALSIGLLVALPVRNLWFTDMPDNARGEGAASASYIMLFLFGALALVFAVRAARTKS
jgi:hypothetical protein